MLTSIKMFERNNEFHNDINYLFGGENVVRKNNTKQTRMCT